MALYITKKPQHNFSKYKKKKKKGENMNTFSQLLCDQLSGGRVERKSNSRGAEYIGKGGSTFFHTKY